MTKNSLIAYLTYIIGISSYLMVKFVMPNQDAMVFTEFFEIASIGLCIVTGFYAGWFEVVSLTWIVWIGSIILIITGFFIQQSDLNTLGLTLLLSTFASIAGIFLAMLFGKDISDKSMKRVMMKIKKRVIAKL